MNATCATAMPAPPAKVAAGEAAGVPPSHGSLDVSRLPLDAGSPVTALDALAALLFEQTRNAYRAQVDELAAGQGDAADPYTLEAEQALRQAARGWPSAATVRQMVDVANDAWQQRFAEAAFGGRIDVRQASANQYHDIAASD